jgi:nicotinate-nucleotide adenylyltransferase
MALAVLGGSFDPVHNGHVAMAEFVLTSNLASKVHVVPAFLSPFKQQSTAPADDRLAMVQQAFAPVEHCVVDTREIIRQGQSYMVETLLEMKEEDPGQSFRLILGADNLAGFWQWHKPEQILTLAKILVLGRQGQAFVVPDHHRDSFIFYPQFDHRVSSTEIRAMLASGEEATALLPAAVARYIQKNGLYRKP